VAETSAPELADWLLARGRTAVSTAQAAALIGVPQDHVRVRLNRSVQTGKLIAPSRGLWIAVPPEFRTWGAPPALDFLDPLMVHLGRRYYVGWLCAAELFGAAHQRPQVTQVAVDKHVQSREVGRSRLRFISRSDVADLPLVQRTVATGQVWVSAPELTALDLADRPERGAGLSNVATVLSELCAEQQLDPQLVVHTARRYPGVVIRRLGYLLELVQADFDTAPLAEAVFDGPLVRAAMLSPSMPRRGRIDPRWGLLINDEVHPDL